MSDNDDDKEVLDMETSKNTWKFTVDTASNDNTTGVPLSYASLDYKNSPSVIVDWGDGTKEMLYRAVAFDRDLLKRLDKGMER